MTKKEPAKITLTNAEDFANELWSKIVDERLFSYQKADICDYLLYLFNAHSKDKFLDTNSNEQNERLLKMNASKIKASKKNIAVKFMDDIEYQKIFYDFLKSLEKSVKENKIVIKNGYLTFIIENNALRDVLDAKLKASAQDVLDYPSIHTEKAVISGKNFIAMIRNEVAKDKIKAFDDMIDKLATKYKVNKTANAFISVFKEAGNFASIVSLTKFI